MITIAFAERFLGPVAAGAEIGNEPELNVMIDKRAKTKHKQMLRNSCLIFVFQFSSFFIYVFAGLFAPH